MGVFSGVGRNAYLLNNLMSHPALRETAADYNMLIGNERDFASTHIAYRLGRKLHINPSTESFVSDHEADAMLTREYRAPFVVPSKV